MKLYKCRCTKRTKKWTRRIAENLDRAAEVYAETSRLEFPDIVTVMNHGRFVVHTNKTYYVVPAGKGQ